MLVVKYIVLFVVVVLTIWLLIDTTITIVKKIKNRKSKKEQVDVQEEDKTE